MLVLHSIFCYLDSSNMVVCGRFILPLNMFSLIYASYWGNLILSPHMNSVVFKHLWELGENKLSNVAILMRCFKWDGRFILFTVEVKDWRRRWIGYLQWDVPSASCPLTPVPFSVETQRQKCETYRDVPSLTLHSPIFFRDDARNYAQWQNYFISNYFCNWPSFFLLNKKA